MCKCAYCEAEIVMPAEVVRYGSAILHADCHEAMNEEIHIDEIDNGDDFHWEAAEDDLLAETHDAFLQAEAECFHAQYDYE